MTCRVQLDSNELAAAAYVGLRRHMEAIRHDHKRPDGTTPLWDDDIEGALAELAFSKHHNMYWAAHAGLGGLRVPDVGQVHIRQAKKDFHKLIVRPQDIMRYGENAPFVLVTGERGRYWIRGWIQTGEARRDEWKENPNGYGQCWMVPPENLWPIDNLSEVLTPTKPHPDPIPNGPVAIADDLPPW